MLLQEYTKVLEVRAVAYANVDIAVQGKIYSNIYASTWTELQFSSVNEKKMYNHYLSFSGNFSIGASASPSLRRLLYEAAKKVIMLC